MEGRARIAVGPNDDFSRKALRRLRPPEPFSVDGLDDASLLIHPLERVDHRQRRDRTLAGAHCGDDAVEARWVKCDEIFSAEYGLTASTLGVIEQALKFAEMTER